MRSWMPFLQQDFGREMEEGNASFFQGAMWLIVFVPVALWLILVWRNRKPRQTVRELTADEFSSAIDGDRPVLVHFHDAWSVGNAVMIAQVEKLAITGREHFDVAFADMELNAALEEFIKVRTPALILFAGGDRIFHCEGVFEEADVLVEAVEAAQRWQANRDR